MHVLGLQAMEEKKHILMKNSQVHITSIKNMVEVEDLVAASPSGDTVDNKTPSRPSKL
jgi:hypothetical protein